MPLFHLTVRESPEGINNYQPMSGMAISRHAERWARESALPPKPDIRGGKLHRCLKANLR